MLDTLPRHSEPWPLAGLRGSSPSHSFLWGEKRPCDVKQQQPHTGGMCPPAIRQLFLPLKRNQPKPGDNSQQKTQTECWSSPAVHRGTQPNSHYEALLQVQFSSAWRPEEQLYTQMVQNPPPHATPLPHPHTHLPFPQQGGLKCLTGSSCVAVAICHRVFCCPPDTHLSDRFTGTSKTFNTLSSPCRKCLLKTVLSIFSFKKQPELAWRCHPLPPTLRERLPSHQGHGAISGRLPAGISCRVCVCDGCVFVFVCMCWGGGLSNVDFPFLRWSELEVLCFPRRMRILLCLWWDDGNRMEAERGTNNGKINRELNLKPQERGFEPKHSGTQCGHIYTTTEWAAGRTKGVSVCDSNSGV